MGVGHRLDYLHILLRHGLLLQPHGFEGFRLLSVLAQLNDLPCMKAKDVHLDDDEPHATRPSLGERPLADDDGVPCLDELLRQHLKLGPSVPHTGDLAPNPLWPRCTVASGSSSRSHHSIAGSR